MPPQNPYVSPTNGQFIINNCKKMAIIRVNMRRGFNPSNYYMIVESVDRRAIKGYRINCDGNRIRFIEATVEYRNMRSIECVF